ncbi:MAG: threonine--tRNA ligase [Acidobacteriota bacterium]|nr:threonine--tRNA ligase [Acidobacteriota bacterium]
MADNIKVKLPDGSIKELPKGTTALEVANSISPRLAQAALVAQIRPSNNGAEAKLVDLTTPLSEDVELRILTEKDPESLEVFRHSSAHLLAAAVLELFPETKLGHGPPTDSGFFYDFYREKPFTPDDLAAIEKKMAELAQQDIPYRREMLSRDATLAQAKQQGDFMKCHFIEQFVKPGEQASFYQTGKFVDFCRGPHIPSTGRIKAFKLLNLAGAYWLGDAKNQQLQRIYGTSFYSKKEMDAYLHQIEEAKKRDHRLLGKQLDLFSIQELAGPGLIFWHPKGGTIRKLMEDWMREEYIRRGYSLVYTPHILRVDTWKVSGHEGYYAKNMYPPMEMDDALYRVKPMNCPGHILIYKSDLRSYRDLPQRYGELGTVYRYELSGVMHGLLRVRGFTQDDAHIFCTPQQIEDEVVGCIEFALAVLKTYGFDQFQVELSDWDPKDRASYAGTDEQWSLAMRSLENALRRSKLEYKTIPGEAAFYGPKIDVKLVDAIGRLWQLSTIQFDFTLPQRFDLEYVGEDGQRHQPVMVHRALYGSIERFFGVLIEHYAGAFPVWLAPVQVAIVPITDRHVGYAASVESMLKDIGVRSVLDARSEKMNAKIREHAMQKVPFILVIGDKEAESGNVNVRTRGKEKTEDMKAQDFAAHLKQLIDSKATTL